MDDKIAEQDRKVEELRKKNAAKRIQRGWREAHDNDDVEILFLTGVCLGVRGALVVKTGVERGKLTLKGGTRMRSIYYLLKRRDLVTVQKQKKQGALILVYIENEKFRTI